MGKHWHKLLIETGKTLTHGKVDGKTLTQIINRDRSMGKHWHKLLIETGRWENIDTNY